MTDAERIAELEAVLTIICGAFPTKLIMNGGVDKVCAELLAKGHDANSVAHVRNVMTKALPS